MADSGSSLTLLDIAVLLLYTLILAGIALYHSRKMKAQDDYFLAGRSMSGWPIALSMFVALFSTNSFLGLSGWVNRPGGTVWIGLQNIGILMVVPLVVLLYPGIFYRLRITTAYEYLERRFSYPVRPLAVLLFLGARIMWMSTMLYAASLVISQMLGWTAEQDGFSEVEAILLVGALGTFFALAGGMHAVIWTDVLQFFVLFGGVACMAGLVIYEVGGVGQVVGTGSQQAHPATFLQFDRGIDDRERTMSGHGGLSVQCRGRSGSVANLHDGKIGP